MLFLWEYLIFNSFKKILQVVSYISLNNIIPTLMLQDSLLRYHYFPMSFLEI